MFADKIMQSILLFGSQFSKLKADLTHLNGAEAVFIVNFEIENFPER